MAEPKIKHETPEIDGKAEDGLLAAMLQMPELIGDLVALVPAADYLSRLSNQILYQVLRQMSESGQEIMRGSVKDYIDHSKLENREAVISLLEVVFNFELDASSFDYAHRVRESWVKRQALRLGQSTYVDIARANGNMPSRLAAASEQFQAAAALAAGTDDFLLKEGADDEGNAQCLNRLYAGAFLHCAALGWLFYDGRCWRSTDAEAVLDRAIVDTLKRRRLRAVFANMEQVIKAARPSAANIRNCKYLFKSLVVASVDSFDADPDVLNCYNGVIDLRTGELVPHDPGQRFTYCLRTPYDPEADSDGWTTWLYEAITPEAELLPTADNDGQPYRDLLNWLRLAVGYSITGRTNEQVMFYIHGKTRAGKGLFLQILVDLLGRPLATGVNFDTFTAKRTGDDQSFDLAPLKPARFVVAGESNRASMLNSKVVKAITGNDPVYCAHKHRDFFSYTPQYKIWLSSNFEIMADADDEALWGRLRVIEFANSYLGREDRLKDGRLRAGMPGILAWAVSGAIDWYKLHWAGQGLENLPAIRAATDRHREKNDTLQMFLSERAEPGEYTTGAAFTLAYTDWCKENGFTPLGGRRLGASMRQKGYEYKTVRPSDRPTITVKAWTGIKLT